MQCVHLCLNNLNVIVSRNLKMRANLIFLVCISHAAAECCLGRVYILLYYILGDFNFFIFQMNSFKILLQSILTFRLCVKEDNTKNDFLPLQDYK